MGMNSKGIDMLSPKNIPETEKRLWNTKNLGLRVGVDLIAGIIAATSVAPIITVLDKYVLFPVFTNWLITSKIEQPYLGRALKKLFAIIPTILRILKQNKDDIK